MSPESLEEMNAFVAKTGGPAFPQVITTGLGESVSYPGLTLRDYIAAKALAALIATDKDYQHRGKKAVPILVSFAYEYADAMLTERFK